MILGIPFHRWIMGIREKSGVEKLSKRITNGTRENNFYLFKNIFRKKSCADDSNERVDQFKHICF